MIKAKIALALILPLFFMELLDPFLLSAETLKPANRKAFKKLDRKLETLKKSWLADFIENTVFKTGTYLALTDNQTRIIEAQATPKKVTSELKVVTANLLQFPPPFFTNQKERIASFAATIKPMNPDIIVLQEVWDNGVLLEICRHFADYNVCYKPSILYNKSGLLTLSRFRIVQSEFRKFPLSIRHNFEEFLAGKGVLKTVSEINNEKIAVFNTHLYSSPAKRKYRPNIQQFLMLQKIAEEENHDLKLIAGDMNLLPEEIAKLAAPDLLQGDCLLPTAGGAKRVKKLDYIFILGADKTQIQLTTKRIDSKYNFSDHSPVFGKIRLSD